MLDAQLTKLAYELLNEKGNYQCTNNAKDPFENGGKMLAGLARQ